MSRLMMKNFRQFCWFVQKVKNGERTIIIGMDYVVMDKKSYDRLTKKEAKYNNVCIEEELNNNQIKDLKNEKNSSNGNS